VRTCRADPDRDPSTKRPRRDPQTIAMVQGAMRHFERIQGNLSTLSTNQLSPLSVSRISAPT